MPNTSTHNRLGLYRKGNTSPEHRRHITVGRSVMLEDSLEKLRSGAGKPPKHHQLFIAARGMGKTHFLTLIEDEIEGDEKLSQAWHVARFPEEANRVLSFADFLLVLCEILRDTLPDEPAWTQLLNLLSTEEDDQKIVDTVVPELRKRYKTTGQALVIMMENLNQIFQQQIKNQKHIASLRGLFMESKNGCLLLASAPIQFDAITDSKKPFYDFFDVRILDQLSDEETIELIRLNLEWDKCQDLLDDFQQLRPRLLAIYRMTGGNPRLTHMLYQLIAHESITEVKQQFHELLDRITPFYQDRLNDLAPQERAVLETLATALRRKPKTPTAIAAAMRMSQPQVSNLLGRLTKAGYLCAIQSENDKRSRSYVIREGFFDIWLAMNMSRGERRRLPFLLDFFAEFYPKIEERNRKREELRQRLQEQPTTDILESLDLLSAVGEEEEQAAEKLRLAAYHHRIGSRQEAKSYLNEVGNTSLGTWIRGDTDLLESNFLEDIENLVRCWEARRERDLESHIDQLKLLTNGLNYHNWSEAKIAFIRNEIAAIDDQEQEVWLRLDLGNALHDLAYWDQAEEEKKLALKLSKAKGSRELQAVCLNDLALLFQHTGRLEESERLIKQALSIDEESFGSDHPRVAARLNNLATLLLSANRPDEAEPIMKRALAIDEAAYGPEHPNVAIDLNNLGTLFQNTNRLDEAEELMKRALAIGEKVLGSNHPKIAIRLNNLAQLLSEIGRLDEADPLLTRALAIEEASFGPDHPQVAKLLNNLAQLCLATNRMDEAEPLMRRALAIEETIFGSDHPRVAKDLNNLALMLCNINQWTEAESLMGRALQIFADSLGKDHPSTQAVSDNYNSLKAAKKS